MIWANKDENVFIFFKQQKSWTATEPRCNREADITEPFSSAVYFTENRSDTDFGAWWMPSPRRGTHLLVYNLITKLEFNSE